MSQTDETIDDEAIAAQFAEDLADWNSSFDPFMTADGYDYATYMLHFNDVFASVETAPNILIDKRAYMAPGASVTFSIH